MMLRPIRFLTSSASAERPSTRAKPCGSLNVRRTVGDVLQRDHPVARDLDRQPEHVRQVLDQARHLDREPALADVPGAGGDQLVVAVDQAQHRLELEVVGLDPQGIDHDLDHLLAIAADLDLEHVGQGFQPVLQIARQGQQRALGHGAGQRDHQHREQGEVDLLDHRLVGLLGQLGLGPVDLLAHVDQGLVDVDAGLELEQHRGVALARRRAQLLEPFQALQLALHRAHQQALRVLGADALVVHRDVDDRQLDVGVGLLGDLPGDHRTPEHDQDQRHDDDAAAVERGLDQRPHAGALVVTAAASGSRGTTSTPTCSPAATKPWPVVITRSCSGRPASQTASVSALAIRAG